MRLDQDLSYHKTMFLNRVEIQTDITTLKRASSPDVVLHSVMPYQLRHLWPLSPDFLESVPTEECISFASAPALMHALKEASFEQAGIFDMTKKPATERAIGLCGIRTEEATPNQADVTIHMLDPGKRAGNIILPTIVSLATYATQKLGKSTVQAEITASNNGHSLYEQAGFAHVFMPHDFEVIQAGPEGQYQTHWETWQLIDPNAQTTASSKQAAGWDAFRIQQTLVNITIE